MRRMPIIVASLVAALIIAAAGVVCGHQLASDRWITDLNHLGQAMQRLDRDIQSGSPTPRDSHYFMTLSHLPLERFDDKSVTFYVGPAAKHSATIEYDSTGTRGLSVR